MSRECHRLPMGRVERNAARALAALAWRRRDWRQRNFVRSMAARSGQTFSRWTASQRSYLWDLVWQHRRQIEDREVIEHGKLSLPARVWN